MSTVLIRGARQLVTLRGPAGPRRGAALLDLSIIPDGAVLIRDGLIDSIGPSRRLENLAAARHATVIDATGRVVMPAFVDLQTSLVHAHPPPQNFERLLEHYDDPDPEVFRDVLDEGARALSRLSSQTLRRRALSIARGMMHHGTATVESRSGYYLDETDIMKVLRVQREHEDYPVNAVSTLLLCPRRGQDVAQWAAWTCKELLPRVRRRRLSTFIDLAYDPKVIPLPIAMRILNAAFELGLKLKVHADFFALSSAVTLALRAEAISVGHLRWTTVDEIRLLANSSCIAVLTPGVDLQTGLSHAASKRALIDAGVIPALASNYHAELSPGYNMQLILLLACRLYGFRPEEAIVAGTVNSAHALGIAHAQGSLEPGKQANIVILKVSDYHEVAYHAGVNIVEKAIRCGETMYDAIEA